jgi:hypothetical protein
MTRFVRQRASAYDETPPPTSPTSVEGVPDDDAVADVHNTVAEPVA